jgi:predicted N-acetyltransferase YhbS
MTMVTIRHERRADISAREALLHTAYGPGRFRKPSQRLREGRLPADGLSLVATERGRVVGTVRLWHVSAGPECPALLLGPLAVHPDCRNRGIGTALVERAIREARQRGHRVVLLVGDAPYYGRFGFTAAKTAELWMPGRFERHRLLALELAPGALDGAFGLIVATGRREPVAVQAPVEAPLRGAVAAA